MSAHAQHAMLALSLVIGLIGAGFIAYVICVGLAAIRDWVDERRVMKVRRIRNQDLDSAYSTGRFSIPKQMRDFK